MAPRERGFSLRRISAEDMGPRGVPPPPLASRQVNHTQTEAKERTSIRQVFVDIAVREGSGGAPRPLPSTFPETGTYGNRRSRFFVAILSATSGGNCWRKRRASAAMATTCSHLPVVHVSLP